MLSGYASSTNNLLEVEVLEREVNFDDAGGFDSRPQNVLLGGLVVLGTESVEVV